MRRWFGVMVLLLALAAPGVRAQARADAPLAEFPFQYTDARVYVPVRIGDGQAVRSFVLDTGATSMCIDAARARASGLNTVPEGSASGAGAGSTSVSRSGPVVLHVGPLALAPTKANVAAYDALLAASGGRHVDGIIGSAFFMRYVVTLDFARRRITVHDPDTWQVPVDGLRVPVTLEQGLPMADVTLTLPGGERMSMRVLVDLGAKSTLLVPEPFIARHGLRQAFKRTVVTGLGAGVGGDTRYAFARPARLAFDSAPRAGLDRPVIGLSVGGTLRSTWYDGLLGAGFLAHYRVTFDYPHRQLILQPRAQPPDDAFDRSGLFLVADGADLHGKVIREVVPGSPADVAGLREGDRLLAMDGTDIARWPLWRVRARLRGKAGQRVPVVVSRGGHRHEATLTLRDLL